MRLLYDTLVGESGGLQRRWGVSGQHRISFFGITDELFEFQRDTPEILFGGGG